METVFTLLGLPTWKTTAILMLLYSCYLFKHPKMPSVFYPVTAIHPNHCSKHCTTGKFNILMLRKFLTHACALLK